MAPVSSRVVLLALAVLAGSAAGLQWKAAKSSEKLPSNSIKGGYTKIGESYENAIYVGRAVHGDAIVAAAVTNYDNIWHAYATWDNETKDVDPFEVAVADAKKVRWVKAADGEVPAGAAAAGLAPDGEVLYVCRVFNTERTTGNHAYMMTVGGLRPSARKCVTEFHGIFEDASYEVMIVDP